MAGLLSLIPGVGFLQSTAVKIGLGIAVVAGAILLWNVWLSAHDRGVVAEAKIEWERNQLIQTEKDRQAFDRALGAVRQGEAARIRELKRQRAADAETAEQMIDDIRAGIIDGKPIEGAAKPSSDVLRNTIRALELQQRAKQ